MVWLVHGTVNKTVSVAFFERIFKMGFPIKAIVADNGPEYKAGAFADALAAKQLKRVFIPARSPNHNAVVERFQGTMLQECWRPAFHRLCFNSVRQTPTRGRRLMPHLQPPTPKPRRLHEGPATSRPPPTNLTNNPNHRPLLSPQHLDRKP